jgi:serine/threonine protein kinase
MWTDDEVYKRYGKPLLDPVKQILRDQADKSNAPSYVVGPALLKVPWSHVTGDILLADFGLAFKLTDAAPPIAGTPPAYAAPELLLPAAVASATGTPGSPEASAAAPAAAVAPAASKAADVWALACVIFELRAAVPLFHPFSGVPEHTLRQQVQVLGRLPRRWWRVWAKSLAYYDDSGVPYRHRPVWPLSVLYPMHGGIAYIGTRSSVPALSGAEADEFEDLLARLLKYEPAERCAAADILRHVWFRVLTPVAASSGVAVHSRKRKRVIEIID